MANGKWWGAALGLAVLSLPACDDGFSPCLLVGDQECFDGTPSWDEDAATSDGGEEEDAAVVDAGLDGSLDASGAGDAGNGVGTESTITQFCERQFATARALLDSCNCIAPSEQERIDAFVQDVLLYRGIDGCVASFGALSATTTYRPERALACAARFDAQFALPPEMARCTSAGLDVGSLEGVVGKGVQFLAQLPECRAAFVGSVARNAGCTSSLQCVEGLRCLPLPGTPMDAPPGSPRSCQGPRRMNETCATNSDCADGLVCSGQDQPARICIPTSSLRPLLAPCQASFECAYGGFCGGGLCQMFNVESVCTQ